jgi:hypothetical protein
MQHYQIPQTTRLNRAWASLALLSLVLTGVFVTRLQSYDISTSFGVDNALAAISFDVNPAVWYRSGQNGVIVSRTAVVPTVIPPPPPIPPVSSGGG